MRDKPCFPVLEHSCTKVPLEPLSFGFDFEDSIVKMLPTLFVRQPSKRRKILKASFQTTVRVSGHLMPFCNHTFPARPIGKRH